MTADEFALRLTGECALLPGAHVLAAVSGGADSVALLCLLDEVRGRLGLKVSCAHVEHGIRGEASIGDMAFVRALCEKKSIPFYAARVDVPAYARAHGLGLEDAARTLRRESLLRIADDVQADCVALAHHALDQAETVLMHAARGSDVRGLCGMRMRSGRVIRPLLSETPQALRAYLTGMGQTWREDETNGDVAYARNRVRHEALPALCRAYPGTVQALRRLAQAAQRDEDYFARQLGALLRRVRPLVNGAAFPRQEAEQLDEALLGRLLDELMAREGLIPQSAQAVEQITRAVYAGDHATVNLPRGGHAHVGGRYVCLTRPQLPEDMPLALQGETQTPFGTFFVRQAQPGETGDGLHAQVIPKAQMAGACIGARRPGDAMVPFGKSTPVKLKKLMIDAGVERPFRDSIPVLRRGETILWAVGLRPSAYCRAAGGQNLMVTFRERTYDSEQTQDNQGDSYHGRKAHDVRGSQR